MRLYLDGRLIVSQAASGSRTRNELPFIVGADVDRQGRPVSFFDGEIDAVRISTVARYAGPSFEPVHHPKLDAETILLLDISRRIGPWTPDVSASGAHGRVVGDPRIVAAD